jgi:hypothetical protein
MGKNHHYVPRVYLKRFCQNKSEKIWVFDKNKAKSFNTNIKNVASQMKFYSLRVEDVKDGISTEVIEDILSNFEGHYVEMLDSILGALYKDGHFSVKMKFQVARYILLQMLRTRSFRNSMTEVAKMEGEIYGDEPIVNQQDIALIQTQFMFNINEIDSLARALCRNTWFVGRFPAPSFYTSDTPVVYRAHTVDSGKDLNGLAAPGLELALPLNPYHLLVIFGKEGFPKMRRYDCKILEVSEGDIQYYNTMQVLQSYRTVYSYNDDFDLVRDLLKHKPDIADIDKPRLQLKTK